tara:strand:+ start:349 stop:1461 length:1113 start_codon:yes stop_codon:yes gene_type:complete
MKDMNVILICIDGGRLDRAEESKIFKMLKSKGVFLSQTITYAPYTNSAVHALISGSYGNRNGCFSYWHSIKFKKFQYKTLAKYLQENNFYTYADVHSELVLPKVGFDEYHVFDESNVNLTERHRNILHELSQKKENFFAYLHFSAIHTGIRDSVLKVYDNFSEEYFRNKIKNNERYDNLFNHAENYLESISKQLTELGLWDNSIIVIFSDHGISIGEKFGERAYGAFCYDYTIKTFSYYISNICRNKEINTQVRHIDILPTILDQLEIKIDSDFERIDGTSLLPLIMGEPFEEKIAYTETANPLNEKAPPKIPNTKSVRTSKWKLIMNEYNNTMELYNLEKDPCELDNLIGQNFPSESELKHELDKLQEK